MTRFISVNIGLRKLFNATEMTIAKTIFISVNSKVNSIQNIKRSKVWSMLLHIFLFIGFTSIKRVRITSFIPDLRLCKDKKDILLKMSLMNYLFIQFFHWYLNTKHGSFIKFTGTYNIAFELFFN